MTSSPTTREDIWNPLNHILKTLLNRSPQEIFGDVFGTQNLDKNFNPNKSKGRLYIIYLPTKFIPPKCSRNSWIGKNTTSPMDPTLGDLYIVTWLAFNWIELFPKSLQTGSTRSKLVVWSYMYSNSNISREDSKNHLDHDFQYAVSI